LSATYKPSIVPAKYLSFFITINDGTDNAMPYAVPAAIGTF